MRSHISSETCSLIAIMPLYKLSSVQIDPQGQHPKAHIEWLPLPVRNPAPRYYSHSIDEKSHYSFFSTRHSLLILNPRCFAPPCSIPWIQQDLDILFYNAHMIVDNCMCIISAQRIVMDPLSTKQSLHPLAQ